MFIDNNRDLNLKRSLALLEILFVLPTRIKVLLWKHFALVT